MPISESANMYNNFITLRSGLTIYPSQDRAIDQVLKEMAQSIPARFMLLCDVSGQIISARGDRGNIEPLALGALTASDMAASQEIARMLGEYQSYQITLREGTTSHTFIAEAGPYMVLLVQVDTDVPLGWARMMILKNAQRLAAIVNTLPEELNEQHTVSKAGDTSASVSNLLEEGQLPEMFGDALDDLWTN